MSISMSGQNFKYFKFQPSLPFKLKLKKVPIPHLSLINVEYLIILKHILYLEVFLMKDRFLEKLPVLYSSLIRGDLYTLLYLVKVVNFLDPSLVNQSQFY